MLKQPNTNEENPYINVNANSNLNLNPSSFFFPLSNSLLTQNSGLLETHFVSQSLENFETLKTTNESPLRPRRKRKLDDGKNPKPKKRTGKSDRHSKIYTAQGPRDRRMRLSVHIARKFFDLQDMLGFDKASKTIEWLFCQSNAAIRDVALNIEPQMDIYRSPLSDCENGFQNGYELRDNNDCELGKVIQVSQANNSRDKTRARARERTVEKSKGVDPNGRNPDLFKEFGVLRSLEEEKYSTLQEAGAIESFIGETSSSASNSIFDFDKYFSIAGGVDSSNTLMGMFGNWDMMVPLTGNVVQEENPNLDLFIQFQSHFQ